MRRLARDLASGILALTSGAANRGEATWAPRTMQHKLTRKLNTITFAKYHLALADGADKCRRHGLDVVLSVCRGILDAGVTDEKEILKAPFGSVKPSPADGLKEYWFLFKNGPLRYRARKLLGRYKVPPGVK